MKYPIYKSEYLLAFLDLLEIQHLHRPASFRLSTNNILNAPILARINQCNLSQNIQIRLTNSYSSPKSSSCTSPNTPPSTNFSRIFLPSLPPPVVLIRSL